MARQASKPVGRRCYTNLQSRMDPPKLRKITQHLRSYCASASHVSQLEPKRNKGAGWALRGSLLSSHSFSTSLLGELGIRPLQESKVGQLVAYLPPKQDFLLFLMHGKGTTSGNRKWNRL